MSVAGELGGNRNEEVWCSSRHRGRMAPRTTISGFATGALLRKLSSRRNSKGAAEPDSPVHLDSAASVSDELAAVLLDDGSLPIGMTPEDAIALQQMRRASTGQVVVSAAEEAETTAEQVAPLQRKGSAHEALKAAESGLSPRELRQQRSSATLAAAEAPAVPAVEEAAEEAAEGSRCRRSALTPGAADHAACNPVGRRSPERPVMRLTSCRSRGHEVLIRPPALRGRVPSTRGYVQHGATPQVKRVTRVNYHTRSTVRREQRCVGADPVWADQQCVVRGASGARCVVCGAYGRSKVPRRDQTGESVR